MTFGRPTLKQLRAQRVKQRRRNLKTLATTPSRALGRATYSGTTAAPVQKRVYIRSRALLAAVRKLPCQITGRTDGVEASHSNWPQHGKAGAIKADDNRVAAIHHTLHRELDQGSKMTAEQRQRLWWDAHCRTVRALVSAGNWPAKVPVPNIEAYPW